jgi:hypothetical protein
MDDGNYYTSGNLQESIDQMQIKSIRKATSSAPIAHACNPNYLGD